jgi:hypothetical protein
MDLMLASAIFLGVSVSLMSIFITWQKLYQQFRIIQLAWQGAQQKMEELGSQAFANFDLMLTEDRQSFTEPFSGLIDARGFVQVQPEADNMASTVYVTVSFRDSQGRVIGEDTNLNGWEPAEDRNGNGLADSPVQLVTRFARR